jgi:hypothetical protein
MKIYKKYSRSRDQDFSYKSNFLKLPTFYSKLKQRVGMACIYLVFVPSEYALYIFFQQIQMINSIIT